MGESHDHIWAGEQDGFVLLEDARDLELATQVKHLILSGLMNDYFVEMLMN